MPYLSPNPRTTILLDLGLAVWIAVWAVIGLAVAGEVRDLRQVGDTLITGGSAFVQTGRTLESLSAIPFVGEDISEAAGRIEGAGQNAQVSGRASARSIENLTVLLGLSVGLVPTVPLVILYSPWRLSRWREVRSVRRVLRTGERDDPAFREFLARRAAQHLPYHRLRAITPNPWDDLATGNHQPLADAELRRLGLRFRPPGRR